MYLRRRWTRLVAGSSREPAQRNLGAAGPRRAVHDRLKCLQVSLQQGCFAAVLPSFAVPSASVRATTKGPITRGRLLS